MLKSSQTIAWIYLLIICCSLEFIAGFIGFLRYLFNVNFPDQHFFLMISIGIQTGVVMIIILKGLRTPEIFSGPVEKTKYWSSHLRNTEKENIHLRLEEILKIGKVYRQPSLTLDALAQQLSTKQKYLSQIINEYYGKSFTDLINQYRIQEAKQMLRDQDTSQKTILEILYEVGFNSKTSFNTAFKNSTNMTPTEYRQHYCGNKNRSPE